MPDKKRKKQPAASPQTALVTFPPSGRVSGLPEERAVVSDGIETVAGWGDRYNVVDRKDDFAFSVDALRCWRASEVTAGIRGAGTKNSLMRIGWQHPSPYENAQGATINDSRGTFVSIGHATVKITNLVHAPVTVFGSLPATVNNVLDTTEYRKSLCRGRIIQPGKSLTVTTKLPGGSSPSVFTTGGLNFSSVGDWMFVVPDSPPAGSGTEISEQDTTTLITTTTRKWENAAEVVRVSVSQRYRAQSVDSGTEATPFALSFESDPLLLDAVDTRVGLRSGLGYYPYDLGTSIRGLGLDLQDLGNNTWAVRLEAFVDGEKHFPAKFAGIGPDTLLVMPQSLGWVYDYGARWDIANCPMTFRLASGGWLAWDFANQRPFQFTWKEKDGRVMRTASMPNKGVLQALSLYASPEARYAGPYKRFGFTVESAFKAATIIVRAVYDLAVLFLK